MGSQTIEADVGMAVISPAKTHITLAFSRGAEFEDKYGLLEGVGKYPKISGSEMSRTSTKRQFDITSSKP